MRRKMKVHSILMMLLATSSMLALHIVAGELPRQSPLLAGPVVGLFDEVQELFPDTKLHQPVKRLEVQAPRNTVAGVHVLITGLRGMETIAFSESDETGNPTQGTRWYRLIDVPVAENTGLDRNTEKYSGMKNPFVIRRAPFRIYDPFRPVKSPITAESTSVALRLEIPIDSAASPRAYRHRLSIVVDGRVESLEYVLSVHRATVPPLTRSTVAYINWLNLDNICSAHNVTKWSEPFWDMLAKYAHTMTGGRQNAFWFIWGDYFTFDSVGNVSSFRGDRLERYIRVFLDAGMKTIHGAPMFGRRNWSSIDMLLSVRAADGKEVDAVSERGKRMLAQMAQRIIAVMRGNGWENQWLQGVFDEPEDPFVDRYRELVSVLRRLKPDIKILEATMTMKVTGLVDVWCPQVQEYQANREFFDQRKAAGDRVWVYTCLSPGGPWLNRLLDEERLRQVYIGWALAKYDLQGFLHWGGNFHTAKPFEELVRFHMEGQYLPAGDSHILYPLPDGPLSSHRFEAHRIGFEDYELLAQLKSHDGPRAQQIIARVVQGFDKYSKDVAAYRAARELLLEAVDEYTVK
jgi:Glycoside hydrolase 123, catalytic domain